MEIFEYDFPTPSISKGQLAGNNVRQQKMFCSLPSSTTILIRRKEAMEHLKCMQYLQ
jgi:hypothetical protein